MMNVCSVEGCNRMTKIKMCPTHRYRLKKYGKVDRPSLDDKRAFKVKSKNKSLVDQLNGLLPDKLFKQVKVCLEGHPIDSDLAYEAQCEEREEYEREYWYMNLKDRDFIERDLAKIDAIHLPF